MANTYSFYINSVECYTQKNELENVIFKVHWTFKGVSEDGIKAGVSGIQELDDPDPNTFMQVGELTQGNVIEWIKPKLNINNLTDSVSKKIEEIKSPTKVIMSISLDPDQQSDNDQSTATEETV